MGPWTKIWMLICVTCLSAITAGKGQPIYQKLMQNVKSINYGKRISYDYKITVTDKKSNAVTDSVAGKLYKFDAMYVDSGSAGITSVNKDYYCKVVPTQKKVTVYNIHELEKKLNITRATEPDPVVSMPDSIITKYAKITVDSSSRKSYRITFLFTNQPFSKVVMDVSKPSYQVTAMSFEESDPKQGGNDYTKTISLDNIAFNVSEAEFDQGRIYKWNGNKIILNKAYAHYKLTTLTN